MVGSATVTAVPSTNAMLEPSMVTARTHLPAFGEHGETASLDLITPTSHGCLIMFAITLLLYSLSPRPEAAGERHPCVHRSMPLRCFFRYSDDPAAVVRAAADRPHYVADTERVAPAPPSRSHD